MSKQASANWTGKTFFLTLWDKNLANMGINPNWKNLEELKASLENALRDITPTFYGALCVSAEGNKHGHIAVHFEKAKRLQAVAKLLGNAHTEPQRGTKEQAINYIEKNGAFAEKGEKILAYFGNKASMHDASGEQVNMQAIFQAVKKGTITASNLDEYIYTNAKTESQARAIESAYNRALCMCGNEQRHVTVVYVEGETGSGKTRGAYERYKDIFRTSVSDRTSFPFNGYRGQKVLLLDELRPNQYKPAELFQILDGYPMSVDIKGGRVPAMWETVVITTAMRLDDWYKDDKGKYTQDNNRKQFERRISYHYIARDGQWHEYTDAQDFDSLPEVLDTECPFS